MLRSLLLAGWLSLLVAGAAASQASSVAVLPIANSGSFGQDRENFEALQLAIPAMVASELARHPGLRLVEGFTVATALVKGKVTLDSFADSALGDREVGAMAKYLSGQQVAGSSELIRELAKTHGTGFGLTTSPDRVRAETLDALRSSVTILQAKAPTELDSYRQLVLGVAQAVAAAKGGEAPVERAIIEQIREGLGAD